MTSMRLRLKLRGVSLYNNTDVGGASVTDKREIFSFGGLDWHTLLFDPNFPLDETYATEQTKHGMDDLASHSETLLEGLPGCTWKYLYPNVIKPIMIIDGTVRGAVKFGFEILGTTGSWEAWTTKLEIFLKEIDSDGNEIIIGSTTQDYKPGFLGWVSILGTESSVEKIFSLPFFFDVNNYKLIGTSRLEYIINLYGQMTNNLLTEWGRWHLYDAVNTDNTFIDIPIV